MNRDQVINLSHGVVLHYAPACKVTRGPRGRVTVTNERWRFSGAAKTWKRNPAAVSRPIKHGLRNYGTVTERNMADFVPEHECPVCIAGYAEQYATFTPAES